LLHDIPTIALTSEVGLEITTDSQDIPVVRRLLITLCKTSPQVASECVVSHGLSGEFDPGNTSSYRAMVDS